MWKVECGVRFFAAPMLLVVSVDGCRRKKKGDTQLGYGWSQQQDVTRCDCAKF